MKPVHPVVPNGDGFNLHMEIEPDGVELLVDDRQNEAPLDEAVDKRDLHEDLEHPETDILNVPVSNDKPVHSVNPDHPEVIVPNVDGFNLHMGFEPDGIELLVDDRQKESSPDEAMGKRDVHSEDLEHPEIDILNVPVSNDKLVNPDHPEVSVVQNDDGFSINLGIEPDNIVDSDIHEKKVELDHPEVIVPNGDGLNLHMQFEPDGIELLVDDKQNEIPLSEVVDKMKLRNANHEDFKHPETDSLNVRLSKDTDFNLDKRIIFPIEGIVDGSGSVSERSEDLHGRSFLPVDQSIESLSNNHAQERQKFKKCLTPDNESGNCVPIQLCSVPNVASGFENLLKNPCMIDEVFIGVCCPEFPVETVRVDWDQFEDRHSETFIEDNSKIIKECGKLPTSVGGNVAWPWMAPLVAGSTGTVFCGGTLINKQYVLSAAHCTTRIPRNRILVRLVPIDAARKSEDFEVVEIKRHARYNSRTMQNDIALLKLSKPVQLGDFRRLICLPDDDQDYVGETGILLSSKKVSEKKEELETLPVISNQECQNKMGVVIGSSTLCTTPRKQETTKCNDDSGASLIVGEDKQFKVVGVLTWNRNDCDERFPSTFTRVSKYRKWIDTHAV